MLPDPVTNGTNVRTEVIQYGHDGCTLHHQSFEFEVIHIHHLRIIYSLTGRVSNLWGLDIGRRDYLNRMGTVNTM
jgi:hypothetical protein